MTQSQAKLRVAFQGEPGAFSEEAAVKLLGDQIETVPRLTFEAMFAAIADGAADLILAPVENSLAGSVYRCYDLLLESKLSITAEVVLPISHNLIGPPGATIDQVRFVQSHPVALAQCTRFFETHPRITRVVAEDTGGSVREVVLAGDPQRAAIASRRAAEIYGGSILQSHLEDHRQNYTRFVLLLPSPACLRGPTRFPWLFFCSTSPGPCIRLYSRSLSKISISLRLKAAPSWAILSNIAFIST